MAPVPTSRARRLLSRAVRRVRFGRLRYVVFVSYGRTGSTLLQGIVMTAPHVLIRGEQGGTLLLLQKWYEELCRHQRRLTKTRETSRRHPFFGIGGFRPDEALRRIRLLLLESLLRPRPDTKLLGFKENNWPDDVLRTLRFLQGVFPGVRFVVNTRDLDAVAASGFYSRRADAEALVRRRHAAILAAVEQLGDDVYHVHYDDWVRDPEQLRGLFEWLGLPFDLRLVKAVMVVPHSYRNRTIEELEAAAAARALAREQAALEEMSAARQSPAMRSLALAWAAVISVQLAALVTGLAGVGPFGD